MGEEEKKERMREQFSMKIYQPGGFAGFFMPDLQAKVDFIEEYE